MTVWNSSGRIGSTLENYLRREGQVLKKIMMLAAMLAMVLTAAAPAMAQVEQDFDQDSDSGDADQTFTVTGGGSNGSSCTPLSGTSQTGNVQDATGTTSFDSDIEDFEQDEIGSDLSVSGGSSTECTQEVNQAAAAGAPKAAPAPAPKAAPAPAPKAAPAPAPKVAPAPAPAPKAEVKAETPEAKAEAKAAAPAPAPAPAPKMEEKKKEEKKKEEKELPKTGGGTASLLTLGAGALLVGGGLLARRMTR
ncbi:MAG: hypothetical protein AVDCRST_MAG28-606 [uncultured Rubrobacteraceae bacterium]|uniref:Gram-positive cocci surface proteins LPxTG domain-containing protein n=1 Tax=uncultured Rubrobacteraceae bacterium TaxID=349277 RepID=A0A6J4QHU2_9ACTN|nr:MAG: hypothetical protein AVDCRST_MAG28-606 [uncultured Rubrobacteraceae bacterium]